MCLSELHWLRPVLHSLGKLNSLRCISLQITNPVLHLFHPLIGLFSNTLSSFLFAPSCKCFEFGNLVIPFSGFEAWLYLLVKLSEKLPTLLRSWILLNPIKSRPKSTNISPLWQSKQPQSYAHCFHCCYCVWFWANKIMLLYFCCSVNKRTCYVSVCTICLFKLNRTVARRGGQSSFALTDWLLYELNGQEELVQLWMRGRLLRG